ncbi:MAG: chloride channel protein [Acidimicrobiales bacterium]|jgi:chloride channel protein, CIC family
MRSLQARAARWLATASYGRKWLVLGALIGITAGLGAVVFYEALRAATHLFLGVIAGYTVPTPVGEGSQHASAHFARPWAIPLVACVGALAGAILVFGVAPEAEGHGTDAAISAVHHNPRGIRLRAVAVKIVASALTIGSGGSGGREGPTGQISAGFGSFLARLFDLSPSDARIAVASGIGSGIGSIFGAPLGGAVLATEIMYRDDFEVEALLPSFIASIVGYVVFGSIEGFSPLFGNVESYRLTDARQLLWFGLIGILGGLIGLLYAKGFYGIADLFGRLPIPRWVRPALGGLVVGCIALAIPEVLGTGYGWIQESFGLQLLHIPLWIVLVLPFARIATTGLSIGSGGSGGIFGPGMVIGAFVGAAVWRLLEPIVPSLGHNPAPYVIVGMMSCFGSISRAPLAVMLMVAEMTGTLTLIVPAMVAVGLATLIIRRSDDTIYRSQLRSRSESPAHRILTGLPLLGAAAASEAMAAPRCVVSESLDLATAQSRLEASGVEAAPFVDAEERYVGIVTLAALRRASAQPDEPALATLVDTSFLPIHQAVHLDVVLDTLTSTPQAWVAVVDDERRVIGTIATSDLIASYRRSLQASLRRVSEVSGPSGTLDVVVAESSPIVGASLRAAAIPQGVLVTAIERGREVIRPTGDTVICAGDRLMVLGGSDDLTRLKLLASAKLRQPDL